MDVTALREQFTNQMPGLAQFNELATAYEQLLAAYVALEQKWNQASPARVQALEQTIADLRLAESANATTKGGLTP